MATRVGLSASTVGRIWRRFDLKPHLVDGFKLSSDPQFVAKVVDVVGLYHNPPDKAVVLCVDEKSQMQALDRSQPVLPMMPGMPERRTHDYARHGVVDLFAAFNIADGTVITELHPQHRAVEFKKFLIAIDKAVPNDLDVHLICDNLATHKTTAINDWFDKHPRFHMTLHADRLVVDQPGGTLVRSAHRPTPAPRRSQKRCRTGKRRPRLDHRMERQPKTVPLDQNRRRDPRLSRQIYSTNFRRDTLGTVIKCLRSAEVRRRKPTPDRTGVFPVAETDRCVTHDIGDICRLCHEPRHP